MGSRFLQGVHAATAIAISILRAPAVSAADGPDRDACILAYVDAQNARKQGDLLRAVPKLEVCVRDTCPGMLKRDCALWLTEVQDALPSIVLSARDERGRDLTDVTATVDGTVAWLDGQPVALNPGKHIVRFERRGQPAQEVPVVLVAREKSRKIGVTFSAPTPTPAPSSTPAVADAGGIPIGSYVLAGVGALSGAAFGFFAIRGADARTSLGCDRGCPPDDYARVNRDFVAADIALVSAVVALGGAVVWWLADRGGSAGGALRSHDASKGAFVGRF